MSVVNKIVFIAFLILGVLVTIGYSTDKGHLVGLSSYFGVMLIMYSVIAFGIIFILSIINNTLIWNTLYPANFSFSLIAYSMLEFIPKHIPYGVLIAVCIGVGIGWVINKYKLYESKYCIIALVAACSLSLSPIINDYWSVYFLTIATIILSITKYKVILRK